MGGGGQRFKTLALEFGSGSPVTTLISGVFAFGDKRRNPLFGSLPTILTARERDHGIAPLVALLDAELLAGRPGAETVSTRLADIVFIEVVRTYLLSNRLPPGWLRGMADPAIGPALALIQSAPGEPWSVESLARSVGLSRSRFAARFQEVVGQAPLAYLTEWRMYQAAGQLADGTSLKSLARTFGYASEVSFAKAFRRWSGRSPTAYRRWLAVPPEPHGQDDR